MDKTEVTKHPIPEGSTIISPVGKSWVASRFVLIEENGISKRRCSFLDCGKEYSRGTSHMILKRHWSRQHNDYYSAAKPSLRSNQSSPNTTPRPKSAKKRTPKNLLKSPSPRKTSDNHRSIDINISNNSQNSNKLSNILDKAQSEVKQVSRRLREAYSIHLTLDIFAPKKCGKTFGIITAHSFNDTLEMKSVLLEYKHLYHPDDTNTIYEFLRSCFAKFNIKEKIVSIASNSSPIIAAALNEIDKRFRISKNYNFSTFHIKCFPQFVHQNVAEVLRSQENLIDNIRKFVHFATNNNITYRPMEPDANDVNEQNRNSLGDNTNNAITTSKTTGLKLPFDTRNSWNTTYNMIETFFQQRSIIEPTLIYLQNTNDLTNVTIDWDRLYTLIQLLKPFYEVIHKFASDNYTPVSLIAVCIPHLMDHLSNNSWAYDDLIMAAHDFKMQLESYRQNFQSDTTVIAGLLDSRVKDSFVSPEGRNDAIEILRKRMEAIQQKNENSVQALHLYPVDSLWSRIFKPMNYDEIIEYLESPREHGNSNNNAYWEAHKQVYPNLYVLAKTLACVQATSVTADRMFSASENMEKERKIQIDSANSRELMKSWAKYLEK